MGARGSLSEELVARRGRALALFYAGAEATRESQQGKGLVFPQKRLHRLRQPFFSAQMSTKIHEKHRLVMENRIHKPRSIPGTSHTFWASPKTSQTRDLHPYLTAKAVTGSTAHRGGRPFAVKHASHMHSCIQYLLIPAMASQKAS